MPHLTQAEVPLLLAAIDPASNFAAIDRTLYLTAIMRGLRQGELIALRWRDVKWTEHKVSIRLNRTRKHGDHSPKSKASRRDVPMPDAVGGELDRLYKTSRFQADDARVFGNPTTGAVRAHVPMRTLQQWMGHARISTTEIYASFAKDQREVELIENVFAALSQSVTHSEQN